MTDEKARHVCHNARLQRQQINVMTKNAMKISVGGEVGASNIHISS